MIEKEGKNEIIIVSADSKKAIPVPPGGSLGLLALGYRGILAWREARNSAIKAEKLNNQIDKKQ